MNTDIEILFKQEMNKHGYGFQYSVIAKVKELFGESKTKWWPLVSEFPVATGDAKIDFILRYSDKPLYLIAECKRVNPALSNWCFLKASASNYFLNSKFYTEALHTTPWNTLITGICDQWISDKIYNIALEVKENVKGDSRGSGRGQIEDSATQVCKGLNGLINYFKMHQDLHRGNVNVFIPVIFTTANLFVSETCIEDADIATGEVNETSLNVRQEKWLHYHYPQTPTIKHAVRSLIKHNDLREIVYCDYIRNIPVVNYNGIEDFLCSNPWYDVKYRTIQMEQQK